MSKLKIRKSDFALDPDLNPGAFHGVGPKSGKDQNQFQGGLILMSFVVDTNNSPLIYHHNRVRMNGSWIA